MNPDMPADKPLPSVPIADDGDSRTFCTTCAFSSACVSAGYGKRELADLQCLIEHVGPYQKGDYLFRTGDTFQSIYSVRRGMVKTSVVDTEGREQVLGFYLPGEVVGLNAIYPERYPCDAVALERAEFCRFSFPAMSTLAARVPAVQTQLFRMLSRELGMASMIAGDHTADQRLAAFLVNLGNRHAASGGSAARFRLSMSRTDIANYLRLASETVSRILGRFRTAGLLEIEGRNVHILDAEGMRLQARDVLAE